MIVGKKKERIIMKKYLLSSFVVAAMLAITSCTSETEDNTYSTKITKIYVGAETTIGTKTNTNASTSTVTWADGDEIAVFHVNGSGRSDYKRFILTSGAGESSAYFAGATAEDYLTPGETYKVVYPYSSVENYNQSNDFLFSEISQSTSGNISHIAQYDWLYSASKTIGSDGTVPAFLLKHVSAFLRVRLDIANYTASERRYLRNFNVKASNGTSKLFANYIYWNDELNFTISQYTETATVGYSESNRIVDGTFYYYFPIIQDPSLGIEPLTFTSYWATSTSTSATLYSSDCQYTPSSVLRSGYVYDAHFQLTFNDGSANTATLTIVND